MSLSKRPSYSNIIKPQFLHNIILIRYFVKQRMRCEVLCKNEFVKQKKVLFEDVKQRSYRIPAGNALSLGLFVNLYKQINEFANPFSVVA